ncbi:MAG: 50S ribosomal protein L17 [Elusimicrobia bacterium]|nr:50S ribosomal protein L17 [Elusimicrobiota bacterium]
MIKTHHRRKLGVLPARRRMLLRQLATSLFHVEKLTTTTARAKELKSYAERMISKLQRIQDPVRQVRETARLLAPNGFKVGVKFRETLLPRYQDRHGGYVRVLALPPRKSDGARLSRIELVS